VDKQVVRAVVVRVVAAAKPVVGPRAAKVAAVEEEVLAAAVVVDANAKVALNHQRAKHRSLERRSRPAASTRMAFSMRSTPAMVHRSQHHSRGRTHLLVRSRSRSRSITLHQTTPSVSTSSVTAFPRM
jgi:hypothetical protein